MSPKSEIGNQKSEASSFRRLPLTFVLLFLIWTFCLQTSASASCFSPTGIAGDLIYSGGMQADLYCDGASWVAMGPVGDARTGLIGWWKFDDGSGTSAADSSGSGNTGTTQNSPTWTASGMNNGALTLNGTNQYVNVPDAASLDLSGSWTVSAWVELNVLPGASSASIILDKIASAGGISNYAISVDNTGACASKTDFSGGFH